MRSTRKGIVISCSLPTAYMHSREAGCGWSFVWVGRLFTSLVDRFLVDHR